MQNARQNLLRKLIRESTDSSLRIALIKIPETVLRLESATCEFVQPANLHHAIYIRVNQRRSAESVTDAVSIEAIFLLSDHRLAR